MQVAYLAMYSRHNIKHCINPGRGRHNFPAKIAAPVVPYSLAIFLLFLMVVRCTRLHETKILHCNRPNFFIILIL